MEAVSDCGGYPEGHSSRYCRASAMKYFCPVVANGHDKPNPSTALMKVYMIKGGAWGRRWQSAQGLGDST